MIPSAKMNEQIRQRVIEFGGPDLGPSFKIGHVSLAFEDDILNISNEKYQKKLTEQYDVIVDELAKAIIEVAAGRTEKLDFNDSY